MAVTRSERPEPFLRTTREQEADDAAALLDALDAAPAIVIGRSYGGDIALELARRHPDHVRAIVGLEPGMLHLDPEAKRWADDLNARLRAAEPERVGETLIEAAAGPGGWEALPAEARELFTANGPAILAEVEGLNADLDEAALSAIEHPTLIVSAAESPEGLQRVAARLASLLPNVGGGSGRGRPPDRPRGSRGAALRRALRLERYSFTAVDARFALGITAADEDEMLLGSRAVEPVRRGRLDVAELPPGAVVRP